MKEEKEHLKKENLLYGRLRNSIQYDAFRELQVGQWFEETSR